MNKRKRHAGRFLQKAAREQRAISRLDVCLHSIRKTWIKKYNYFNPLPPPYEYVMSFEITEITV